VMISPAYKQIYSPTSIISPENNPRLGHTFDLPTNNLLCLWHIISTFLHKLLKEGRSLPLSFKP
jgi:hypothetical protein